MLFQHTWKYVVSGAKTQTRRLALEGDSAPVDESDPSRPIIKVVRTADAGVPKTLYQVGQIHSIQPGVAKKTIGNIKITAIRRERLQDISEADTLREMPVTSSQADVPAAPQALKAFKETWDIMHPQPGARWEDNPEVWVLEFELALNS